MRKAPIIGVAMGLLGLPAILPTGANPALAQESPTTVLSDLSGPMGVLVASDGSVWVVETGTGGDQELMMPGLETGEPLTSTFGHSARIIRVSPDGTHEVVANLPSVANGPLDSFGGARVALLNGDVYATSGWWTSSYDDAGLDRWSFVDALVRVENGELQEVVDVWAIEQERNPDGAYLESNPYGLAVGPDGNLWMTDAAGNYLAKVDPASGHTDVVTVFDVLPSPIPNPARDNALVSDPVPTGVAFDSDGNVYVSLLPGFPFLPGSGKVVRVGSDGSVSDYATDLTMLTDIRMGPDGHLYAVSFGEFTEQGPVPNSGALIRIAEGTGSETVVSGLSQPTSVGFNEAGDAYVTINGMWEPGTGKLLMYRGVASPGDH
jgi:sugar lactone lactonase YvrE